MPREGRLGWLAVSIVVLFIFSFWWRSAPAVYSDPAYGLLAAIQHEKGNSSSIFHLRQALNSNLLEDKDGKVRFWAPSYQVVPFLFKKLGLSWGGAIKATFLFSFLFGLIAWVLYFKRIVPGSTLGFFVAVFCLLRFSHNNVWIYDGGELLLGAVFPWVLLANLHAMKSLRLSTALFVGILTSILYLLKYSGLIYTVGFGLAWSYQAYRRQETRLRFIVWLAGAASMLLVILLFIAPMTGTSIGTVGSDSPLKSLWHFTAVSVAMTDLFSLVSYVFQQPSHPLFGEEIVWISLPITFFMGYLFWIGGAKKFSFSDFILEKSVAGLLVIFCATFLVLLAIKNGYSFIDGRHHRQAGIALMPFLWLAVTRHYQLRREKFLSVAGLGLFFIVPAVYGLAMIVDKGWVRMPASEKFVSSIGIRLSGLDGASSAKSFYQELRSHAGSSTLIYIPAPHLAFELADRRFLMEDADFMEIEKLAKVQRRGLPEGGVLLALPSGFDANGKTSVIKSTFKDVRSWKTQSMQTAPAWNLHFSY